MKNKLMLLTAASAFSMAGIAADYTNIVLINLDDVGYGDFSFNGAYGYTTPNIDKMAAEGVRFTHFLAGQPISGASRAGLLTGCYPNRIGFAGAPGPDSNYGIHPDEMTIAEVLKQKGYSTAIFGKWHLGTLTYKEVDANRGRPENKHLFNPPSEHGYDDAFVTESKVPTFDPMSAPVSNNGRFWDYLPEYEEPVALLYLDTQNTFVNVYGVFVDEKLRGKGIGTCLMKHFLKDYFNIASLPLVLNVTSNNRAAVALYKKCGFAEASRIEYHYINCSDN